MNHKQLYISDLDGTLLDPDARLSDRSLHGLQTLLAAGLPFTVATARSVVSVQCVLRGLELPFPIIEFNGAMISDLQDGKHHFVHELDAELVRECMMMYQQHELSPLVSTVNCSKDNLYYTDVRNPGMQWYVNDRISSADNRLQQVPDFERIWQEQIVCITAVAPLGRTATLRVDLEKVVGDSAILRSWESLYTPGWCWLTLHNRRADKGQALNQFREICNLQDCRITAFGDGGNDLGLLRAADRGIAVQNAKPEVLQAADLVIGCNTDDSVVKFLEKDWPKKY